MGDETLPPLVAEYGRTYATANDPEPKFRTAKSGHTKSMQRTRNAVDYLNTK
jgi:hypothetical protein